MSDAATPISYGMVSPMESLGMPSPASCTTQCPEFSSTAPAYFEAVPPPPPYAVGSGLAAPAAPAFPTSPTKVAELLRSAAPTFYED